MSRSVSLCDRGRGERFAFAGGEMEVIFKDDMNIDYPFDLFIVADRESRDSLARLTRVTGEMGDGFKISIHYELTAENGEEESIRDMFMRALLACNDACAKSVLVKADSFAKNKNEIAYMLSVLIEEARDFEVEGGEKFDVILSSMLFRKSEAARYEDSAAGYEGAVMAYRAPNKLFDRAARGVRIEESYVQPNYAPEHVVTVQNTALNRNFSDANRLTSARCRQFGEEDNRLKEDFDRFLSAQQNKQTLRERVIEIVKQKGILKRSTVYKNAGISKTSFSKFINSDRDLHRPSKEIVLAVAVGLHLTMDEAQEFAHFVGYHIGTSDLSDLVFRFFVGYQYNYNIYEISSCLYYYGLSFWGTRPRDKDYDASR